MKKILFPIITLLMLMSSCRKDVDDVEVIITKPSPTVFIKTSIRGKVIDESGNPLANATVKVMEVQTLTDAEGKFLLKEVEVNKSGNIVKVQLEGYFEGAAHSNFSAEGSSYVQVKMMKKNNPSSFENAAGATIQTAGGMELSIAPGAVIYPNGAVYNGAVNAYTRWIRPDDPSLGDIMPGALQARDEDGNLLALVTYGMAAIALETPGGEPLELNPNSQSELRMPIPPDLLSNAPEEIPLWYFDMEEEQWLNKGTCKKEGSTYVCQYVNTTGYWNCDVALPAICLSGQIFNADSTFACYMKVIVEDLTDNFIYWGWTDSIGYFCGSVPQAAPLRIYIVDHCDSTLYTADIGPFSMDFQLEDIYLDEIVETFVINITGSVMHCITNDVPSGHVAVSYPGHLRIFPYEAGGYDITLGFKCTDFPEMKIRAFSNSQAFSTETQVHNVFSDIDLGQLFTCDTISDGDYFYLQVDGQDYWTAPTQYFYKPNTTTEWLVMEGLSAGGKFILDVRDYQGPGTYTSNVFFKVENDAPAPAYPSFIDTSSPDINLEIQGDDGDYIWGILTGTIPITGGGTADISADFRVLREP